MTKTLLRPRCYLQLEILEDRLVPSADMVLQWNDAVREAIRIGGTPAPAAGRIMAITHAAVYDSVNALDRTHEVYLVDALAHPRASREAAVAAAAHRALVAFYPTQAATLDAKLAASLATVPDGKAEDDGVALGRSVADQILSLRRNDGSGVVLPPYLGSTEPGQWRPTPPANAPGLAPHWGGVTPFTMTSGHQFRPEGPPALTSAEYTAAFNEVKELGAAGSTSRSAEETEIALFWVGASPSHWNQITAGVSQARGLTLSENARLFALLNLAGADAYITCFETKYTYNFWRPVTAIRAADTDGNPDTLTDSTWTPLIATPAHPAYSSGHSTFGAAAATVLAGFFGTDNIAFTSSTTNLPGVTRSFASFSAAADENARSRLLAGIHWTFDNLDGLSAGRALGDHVVSNFLRPVEQAPVAGIVNGELVVVGTDGGDLLNVVRSGGDLLVWANGQRLGTFAMPLSGIVVDGGGGNDVILISHEVDIDAEVYGGAGNDLISGGSGDDRIFGEDGYDLLLGNSGNDRLDGGAGDDLLFGGFGNDILLGGLGDDWLFGGPGLDVLDGGPGRNRLFR
jgi:PAP2 superfamily protein/hemolysin type calcium-binding protein